MVSHMCRCARQCLHGEIEDGRSIKDIKTSEIDAIPQILESGWGNLESLWQPKQAILTQEIEKQSDVVISEMVVYFMPQVRLGEGTMVGMLQKQGNARQASNSLWK